MIWDYLHQAGDAVWWAVSGLFLSVIVQAFRGKVLPMGPVYLIAAFGHLLELVAYLGEGEIGRAMTQALFVTMWLFWWWRDRNGSSGRKRRKLKELGAKGRAKIQAMLKSLKPVLQPRRGLQPV